MKYYKDIDIISLNEFYLDTNNERSIVKYQEIKYEFERVSLAYRELNYFSKKLSKYLGRNIKFLDLTYNNLKCLEFLTNFPQLHTLVLDRNPQLDEASLPYLPKLQILWLNNCNIININNWIIQLKLQCPKIKQLSMMCNPVGSTCLNGISQDEEKEYRKEISKLLPTLIYFDGTSIIWNDDNNDHNNKFNINSILQIKCNLLKKKWKSFWDFQNLEQDINLQHANIIENTTTATTLQKI